MSYSITAKEITQQDIVDAYKVKRKILMSSGKDVTPTFKTSDEKGLSKREIFAKVAESNRRKISAVNYRWFKFLDLAGV